MAAAPACDLVTAVEAAAFLKVTPRTLERWRREGFGPAFVQVGPRRVAYRPEDLHAHIEAQLRSHVSQPAAA